jgi:hypothetical protein
MYPTHNIKIKVKVKLSLYRQWRPLGLREFEATIFSDIRLIDGRKCVSPTRRCYMYLRYYICKRGNDSSCCIKCGRFIE